MNYCFFISALRGQVCFYYLLHQAERVVFLAARESVPMHGWVLR